MFQVKFRWLASIYDVLRDSKKREIYDRVLVEGLPNWKNPVFYYRRMRKIGLFEGVVYTLMLTSLIQYAMHWASYFERKYTLQVRAIYVTFFLYFSLHSKTYRSGSRFWTMFRELGLSSARNM